MIGSRLFSHLSPSSPPPHTRAWMARKALTTAAAWRRGGTEFVCVCMLCVLHPARRAETPDMLWKCAVDRGQTGRDLLEEARPAL